MKKKKEKGVRRFGHRVLYRKKNEKDGKKKNEVMSLEERKEKLYIAYNGNLNKFRKQPLKKQNNIILQD